MIGVAKFRTCVGAVCPGRGVILCKRCEVWKSETQGERPITLATVWRRLKTESEALHVLQNHMNGGE